MKHIILTVIVFALGCSQAVPPLPPTIDEATGLTLAFHISFVIENMDSRQIGLATLLAVDEHSFLVAAPVEPVSQSGCRIVEWRGQHNGQKFERVIFKDIEVVASEPRLKLAIVKVGGTIERRAVGFAHTDSLAFHSSFTGYSSRLSQPKPIEATVMKVSGLRSARATPDQTADLFFLVEGAFDSKMIGSPLVTQQGELAGVAVGNFWDSTLYCSSASIRKMLSANHIAVGISSP